MAQSRPAPKKTRIASPAYTVLVALQTTSPFVGDGRMSFADFAFSATFKNVVFVFDPTDVIEVCKVKLRFRAEFGLLDLMWYSKLGSCAPSDMTVEFEVPWRELLKGKPLSLRFPYEAVYPEDKGAWWIEFIPHSKPTRKWRIAHEIHSIWPQELLIGKRAF